MPCGDGRVGRPGDKATCLCSGLLSVDSLVNRDLRSVKRYLTWHVRPHAQIGILGVKGSYTSGLVVPLLFITAVFAYACHGVFARPFQVLSLRGAVDLDNHEQARGL